MCCTINIPIWLTTWLYVSSSSAGGINFLIPWQKSALSYSYSSICWKVLGGCITAIIRTMINNKNKRQTKDEMMEKMMNNAVYNFIDQFDFTRVSKSYFLLKTVEKIKCQPESPGIIPYNFLYLINSWYRLVFLQTM